MNEQSKITNIYHGKKSQLALFQKFQHENICLASNMNHWKMTEFSQKNVLLTQKENRAADFSIQQQVHNFQSSFVVRLLKC